MGVKALCDYCEELRELVWRVDVIERGEGFSYDVCVGCRGQLIAEFGEDDRRESYVERVEPLDP